MSYRRLAGHRKYPKLLAENTLIVHPQLAILLTERLRKVTEYLKLDTWPLPGIIAEWQGYVRPRLYFMKRPWGQRSYNYYDWWSEGVRHIMNECCYLVFGSTLPWRRRCLQWNAACRHLQGSVSASAWHWCAAQQGSKDGSSGARQLRGTNGRQIVTATERGGRNTSNINDLDSYTTGQEVTTATFVQQFV